MPAYLARRFGPQGPAMDDQVAILARREDLRYRTDRLVGSTLDAHRLLHLAKDHGRQHELLTALFQVNFAEAQTIFTRPALLELAVKAGLPRAAADAVLADPTAYLDEVRADEAEAASLGAGGVPYFLIDRRHALSGAQPTEAFAQALRVAWDEQRPAQFDAGTAVCRPDGTCAVPGTDGGQVA
ncbi:putative DsbA family dithiol-disulfide isomerase [Catenulispora sp. GAS73]